MPNATSPVRQDQPDALMPPRVVESLRELQRARRSLEAAQRRHDALVDQYVDWQAWPTDPQFFVYRLLDEHGKVLYVGSSVAVRRRIREHRRRWPGLIASVEVITYKDAPRMLAAERRLIAELQPPLNDSGIG